MKNRLASVILCFSLLLTAVSATSSAFGEEETRGEKAKREQKNKSASRTAGTLMQGALPTEITSAFPIGREFVGVSIPSYEKEKLKSVMRADSIIRVDEKFLNLVNLVFSVYNSEGEHETTISMDEAAYDLTTQELTSKTPAKIEQARFTMTGEQIIFDTKSQFSRLVGNVEVIIPDAGNLFPGIPGANGP